MRLGIRNSICVDRVPIHVPIDLEDAAFDEWIIDNFKGQQSKDT